MITAQLLSIVSVFLSWVWWVTFLISVIGMAMIQVLWCCRQNRSTVFASAGVAVLCALVSAGVGVYILAVWKHETRCSPWDMYSYHYDDDGLFNDDYYVSWRHEDRCEEGKWGTIALVCGLLWSAVSACTIGFVRSGRHARWEKHHTGGGATGTTETGGDAVTTTAVELGTAVLPSTLPGATVPAAAETSVVEAVALPEIVKPDDV